MLDSLVLCLCPISLKAGVSQSQDCCVNGFECVCQKYRNNCSRPTFCLVSLATTSTEYYACINCSFRLELRIVIRGHAVINKLPCYSWRMINTSVCTVVTYISFIHRLINAVIRDNLSTTQIHWFLERFNRCSHRPTDYIWVFFIRLHQYISLVFSAFLSIQRNLSCKPPLRLPWKPFAVDESFAANMSPT